jgi:hypothetical protein
MSDTTAVRKLPACDFCAHEGRGFTEAAYDFRTTMGPWANGCEEHWREHRATARLGTGSGQRLVVADTARLNSELRAARSRRPTAGELEIAMMTAEAEGTCEALDGCVVEPDGVCPHGIPSVLRAAGVI